MKARLSSKNLFWGVLSFLPLALYFLFLSEYAVNIPKWDDHALKAFILDFTQADGFFAKIATFFKQHNEHRIAFDRLITLIVYTLHGSIEYRWLMWVGNFTLIGLLILFWRLFYKNNIHFALFVPVSCLLFQLQLWENTFWGMASMQNFGVILFIFWTIYLISSENPRHFYLAVFAAFMAVFTSGNGILVLPICAVLLALQKRWQHLLIFGIISILLIFSYFYHYASPPSNPPLTGIGIKKIVLGFFLFIGSVADILPFQNLTVLLSAASGFIMFSLAAVISVYFLLNSKLIKETRSLTQLELFMLGTLMFLVGTALIVTVTRISFGVQGLQTSRYKIYSVLLLIIIYTAIIRKIRIEGKSLVITFLIIAGFSFNLLANYRNFSEVVNLRKQLITFPFNWAYDEKLSPSKPTIKLYETPVLFYTNQNIPGLLAASDWNSDIHKTIREDGLELVNTNFEKPSGKDAGAYLLLESSRRTYLVPARQENYPVQSTLKTHSYWAKGFRVNIQKNEFDSGTYHLGLWIQKENGGEIFTLNDSLVVETLHKKTVKTNW
ncbi:hypothetical protein SAMN04515674_109105 [Pseudarcicella hirudinis]|uniref:4-amino-4-deoxy-L-arabinose transferase n=1 Tax=Pseudarcicella hirudinis TaxID=1079859 RepID=A0A1I5VGF2_9BACT|nr:hypothetical protein [Pseudarcicella hirudinis]SFQ06614.1 hypothetical protein SAMN04515674_109105 [Pseudarcicella hirudinis]